MNIPFSIQKNFLWLLETVKRSIDEEFTDYKYVIIGNGNAYSLIEKYIVTNKIDDYIKVMKNMSQKCLVKEYQRAKVLICSSMMEAGATVIVEALYCGVMPIVLNYAGSGEIIDMLELSEIGIEPESVCLDITGRSIYTIVPKYEHFKSLMEKVIKDETWYHTTLERGRQQALSRFNIQATSAKVEKLLLTLI
jgi:glycosyltransferase involved in cell wall biosynthesis